MNRRPDAVHSDGNGWGHPFLEDIGQASNNVCFWMGTVWEQPLSYAFDTAWFGPRVDYEDRQGSG